MITLHTNFQLGTYEADRTNLLERIENLELLRDDLSQLRPHVDRKNSIAIGFGLDLLGNKIGTLDPNTGTYESGSINDLLTRAGVAPLSAQDVSLISQAKSLKTKSRTTLDSIAKRFQLNLGNTVTAENILKLDLELREARLTAFLAQNQVTIGLSRERVALMSMYFNSTPQFKSGVEVGNNLIGNKLLEALRTGNRAEAWFEIRYDTNAESKRTDAASQAVTKGIANRRVEESDIFGLYNGLGPGIPEAEAKDVLRMYTVHRNEIQVYENQFHQYFLLSGPSTIQSQLTAAKAPLLALYADGQTIDGDVLVGSDDPRSTDLLLGTAKADLIFGEKGNDILVGNDGNDVLQGGEGEDELFGGLGNDILKGGLGKDAYFYATGDGNDTIEDSDGLGAIVYDEHVLGSGIKKAGETNYKSLDDTFTYQWSGAPNSDLTITGLGGTLTVKGFTNGQLGITLTDEAAYGDATRTQFLKIDHYEQVGTDPQGNPILEPVYAPLFDNNSNNSSEAVPAIGGDNNLIHALGGNDTIVSAGGDDQLYGEAGADTLFAGGGNDRLYGGDDVDTLYGQDGADNLAGDAGDDALRGGAGHDVLTGAAGHDFLAGETVNEQLLCAA
jgi:hypothetical protein